MYSCIVSMTFYQTIFLKLLFLYSQSWKGHKKATYKLSNVAYLYMNVFQCYMPYEWIEENIFFTSLSWLMHLSLWGNLLYTTSIHHKLNLNQYHNNNDYKWVVLNYFLKYCGLVFSISFSFLKPGMSDALFCKFTKR